MSDTSTWVEIARPAGPQPIPAWCKGVHVEWLMDYSNPPDFVIKTRGESWPDKRFRKDGKRYIAEHPDGRGEMHVHDGNVDMFPIKVFRHEDGSLHKNRGGEWPKFDPGEWLEVPMRATTQQQGYAGRHIWIVLDDGQPLILRGPWHCGAPPGYRSINTVDMDYAEKRRARSPWWKNSGCFGLALREDVLIAVLSRFIPHLPLAKVTYSTGSTTIEPFLPEWGEPKQFWKERQRAARAA